MGLHDTICPPVLQNTHPDSVSSTMPWSKQSLCGSIHWESLHWILLEHFYAQGRVLSDHHVQLSDHSICCECSRKCSPRHASTAHKRHFLGPASAGLQPFAAAPGMVPAHVQSDSVMKDTKGTKYHITWKSALLWPNLLGLFCQNPLQVTVFCCLKQTTRRYTVSDTLIVDLRRNIIRVGSTRSALYLFQTPPHPKSLQPQPLLVHPEGKLALGMRKTWPFFLLAFPFLTCIKPVLANAKLDQ